MKLGAATSNVRRIPKGGHRRYKGVRLPLCGRLVLNSKAAVLQVNTVYSDFGHLTLQLLRNLDGKQLCELPTVSRRCSLLRVVLLT